MRQVFTSQRLETVEGVVRLLNEAGIETWTEQGRSYKGNHRGHFSYAEPERYPHPAVWVVNSADQPRARELLREAGLMESTRSESMLRLPPSAAAPRRSPATHIRMILLIVLTVMAAITSSRMLGLG
jgi:hypothetical protein